MSLVRPLRRVVVGESSPTVMLQVPDGIAPVILARRDSTITSSKQRRSGCSGGPLTVNLFLLPFSFEAGVVLFKETADFVGEVEQALPLLDVKRHRHALQAVDTDAPLFADFAVERAPLRLLVSEKLRRLVNTQLTGRPFSWVLLPVDSGLGLVFEDVMVFS